MPFLYLLYYHKADVTSQTFALCRQNDVLHDTYQFNVALVQDLTCSIPPETGCGLEGPTYKEIIIEDWGWRCYPYFHDVCTEGNTMTLMVDATRRYI